MDNRIISEIVQKISEFEKEEFTIDILCKKRTEIINIIKRFMEKVTTENLSEYETHHMVSPLRYIIDKRYGSKDGLLNEEMFEMTDILDMPDCKSAEEAMQQIKLQAVRMKNELCEARFFMHVGKLLLLPNATQRLLGEINEAFQELEEEYPEETNRIWSDEGLADDFICEIGCTKENILQLEEIMEEVFPEFDEFLGR